MISANSVHATLNGSCALVKVEGNASIIEVGSAQKIVTTGAGSIVRYASGQPRVLNKGGGGVITQGGSATP
ncbi:Protein of unknown function [Amycolatopsis rubida]|uniref:DUF3060 domain-containing protein n=1 Tax=Amycolatopsis rubida TaxID=112413 RepID=A0A1I6B5R0_9PSEU|nr:Protein of unknown function [Amycolatopsis rubida]